MSSQFIRGQIIAKRIGSPTITVLDIHIPQLQTFVPGQWVDFHVPSQSWVGGFSLVSCPSQLPHLTLAIKASNGALPSVWVTNVSKVGDEVNLRVGGDCVLVEDKNREEKGVVTMKNHSIHTSSSDVNASSPSPSSATDTDTNSPTRDSAAVFVAGGIGISPILCMYRQRVQHRNTGTGSIHMNNKNVLLQKGVQLHTRKDGIFYSVSNQDELLFSEEIINLAKQNRDQVSFTLTQQSKWMTCRSTSHLHKNDDDDDKSDNFLIQYQTGRRLREYLVSTRNDSNFHNAIYYLCGPPNMIDDAISILKYELNVPTTRIQYEKWW